MNVFSDLFLRIFSKAHQIISNDNEENYILDFNDLFFPKDEKIILFFKNTCNIASILFLRKKLKTILLVYDSIAFCVKFSKKFSLKGVNPKQLASYMNELPQSTGYPKFFFGTDEEIVGWGLEKVKFINENYPVEIFPLCDFPDICFFIASVPKTSKMNSLPEIKTQFYLTPSEDDF